MSEIDPVAAVNETIKNLDLHADDVAPPAPESVDVEVDLKHKTASVEVTVHE